MLCIVNRAALKESFTQAVRTTAVYTGVKVSEGLLCNILFSAFLSAIAQINHGNAVAETIIESIPSVGGDHFLKYIIFSVK